MGAMTTSLVQLAPPRLPSDQKVRSRSCRSSEMKARTPVSAPASAPSATPAGRNEIEGQRRNQAAAESAEREGCKGQLHRQAGEKAVTEHDGRSRCQAGAGGDADEAGIRERIAEEPLHQGSGNRECGANEGAEQHAREADIEDD